MKKIFYKLKNFKMMLNKSKKIRKLKKKIFK